MKNAQFKYTMMLPYLLICCVGLLRIELVRPFNVVPVFSCLLLFGAIRPAKEFALPLFFLVCVDVFMTTQRYGYPITADALMTWAWYLIAVLLGDGLLRNSRSWRRVAGCSLLASVSFFLASNFAVWAVWQMYPKTLAGLETCYTAALPFFRNSVTSELCFSLLLFGLLNQARSLAPIEIAQKAHS